MPTFNLKPISESFKQVIWVAFGALIMTAVVSQFEFNFLEARVYDALIRTRPLPQSKNDIVQVIIDQATIDAYSDLPPLPLDLHTRFLETLADYSPKALGYLVNMNHVSQVNPELFQGQAAKDFVQAANALRFRGTPVILGTPFDVNGETLPPFPLSTLPHAVAVVHRDGNVFAEDRVTRRALTHLYDRPAFHLSLATSLLPGPAPAKSPRGQFYVPEVDASFFFFRFHESEKSHFSKTYPAYSFLDVLENKVPKEALTGKIILVGTEINENPNDFVITPFSKSYGKTSKVLVHANILDSIRNDNGLTLAPKSLNLFLTFISVFLVALWTLFLSPIRGMFAALFCAVMIMVVGHLAFHGFWSYQGMWIKLAPPLISSIAAYYLIIPFRLFIEHRRRWKYQQTNRLLVQVEELKTNFLSLVTHDLKTPVARIQGLAELLLRKSSHQLGAPEIDSIRHILASTEDLNRFITGILELNRLETGETPLKLESKDLNQLVEKSIIRFQSLAAQRNIQINTDLQPLFPIWLDVDLISKVICNLIDNAIKYSPANSNILITTREDIDDTVTFSVQDNGLGMTQEEMEHLFSRFHRIKNESTKDISGTGLGLYLSKYFVEGHGGRIEVTSTRNQGSCFSIHLPIQPQKNSRAEPGRPGLLKNVISKSLGAERNTGTKPEKKEKQYV